jgi:hypothetical protein
MSTVRGAAGSLLLFLIPFSSLSHLSLSLSLSLSLVPLPSCSPYLHTYARETTMSTVRGAAGDIL